jgi:hypothetical protein
MPRTRVLFFLLGAGLWLGACTDIAGPPARAAAPPTQGDSTQITASVDTTRLVVGFDYAVSW